jgi:hypothetical protein
LTDSQGTEVTSQADMVLTRPLDLSVLEAVLKEFEKQISAASA